MRITIILAISALYAGIFLSSANLAYAQTTDIGQSKIHPAHPLYFLKTVREILELKFAATQRIKMIRQLEIATRRLREVKSLTLVNRQDLIEQNLERYWYHIQSLPVKISNDKELEKKIVHNLAIHLETLKTIDDQVSNPRAKMAIRATVNRITQRAGLPKNVKFSACAFLTKEASSPALNEVEKAVLLDRAAKCHLE